MHSSNVRRLSRHVLILLTVFAGLPVAGAAAGVLPEAGQSAAPVVLVSRAEPLNQNKTGSTEMAPRPALPVLLAEMNMSIFPTRMSVDMGAFPSVPGKVSESEAQKGPPGRSDLEASASWMGVLSTFMLVLFFMFRRTS